MRHLLIAGLVAGLSASAATAQDDQVVTIDTATGPVELTAAPEKVVVFDAPAADTITALGQPIAGLPAPLYIEGIDEAQPDAQTVGTLFEPDYEALAVLQPDLIVAGGRSSAVVDGLSRIATTIDMTNEGRDMVAETRETVISYGTLFGKQAEAEELAAQLDDKVTAVRAAAETQGNALVILTNGGKISAFGADSRFGWLHGALGMPEAHPGLESDRHGQAISFEFIAEANPDWIFVIDRGAAIQADGEAARATLDNQIVASTRAAHNDHIVYLSPGPMYISGGGASSLIQTLDEVLAAFETSASES